MSVNPHAQKLKKQAPLSKYETTHLLTSGGGVSSPNALNRQALLDSPRHALVVNYADDDLSTPGQREVVRQNLLRKGRVGRSTLLCCRQTFVVFV